MIILFLPLVYASMYDHEVMLETATLESEVSHARQLNEHVSEFSKDILKHDWDYKSSVSMDEMFRMTLPAMKGMGLSIISLYDYRDTLVESIESCEELVLSSTYKMDTIDNYFSSVEIDTDFKVDLNQKKQIMTEDLKFIAEICDSTLEDVHKLYAMSASYVESSYILLNRAKRILEEYEINGKINRDFSRPSDVNYTEASANFSLMQNLTNMMYTIHVNLTSEVKESI
jgi:hypothetical protein